MPRKRRVMSEINIVPYVDIMLVLLVIFMVTAPLVMQQYYKVTPPSTKSLLYDVLGQSALDEPVVLSIKPSDDDDSVIYYLSLRKDTRFDPQELGSYINMAWNIHGFPEDHPVQISADGAVPYAYVWEAIELLNNAGVTNTQLVAWVKP